MSKVFLIGCNPPPLLVDSKVEAAHYRTWQFLEALLLDGHQVFLCAEPYPNETLGPFPPEWAGRVDYQAVNFRKPGWKKDLQRRHDAFGPDCVVAVNYRPCLYATRLATRRPLWMDLYGDPLTIMQAACYRGGSDRGILTEVNFMRQILERGDIFSGCGELQGHLTVGELAMTGRLNARNFGYAFTRVVPPGAPRPAAPLPGPALAAERAALGLSADDFGLLWCGGYNTWTDVDTLFAGLEWAMSRSPRVQFVSVGASTYQGADNQYARFEQLVAQSPHRARFHLLGWQPWDKVQTYYQVSHLGINIDALHYETIYGTRTRLLEMIAAGLPVVTSLGSELSYQLQAQGAGRTFEPGDAPALGRHVLDLADRQSGAWEALKQRTLQAAAGDFSFANTSIALREWVQNPSQAPDRARLKPGERWQAVEHRARAILRQVVWRAVGLDR